jgi:glycine betaine/choline ABC-type transport system substrate-binding protein
MAAGNSTDGLLSILDVTVLEDDRACFPPYQAAIAVRDDALKREPKLRQALGELEGRFTEATMRRLNYQATVQHGRVQDVATQFLRDSGLR